MPVTFTTVSPQQQIQAAHHNEIVSSLDGTPGGGKILAFTDLTSNTNPALVVRNHGTGGAWIAQSTAGVAIAQVFDTGFQVAQTAPASAPATGFTSIYSKSGGRLYRRAAAGAETLLGDADDYQSIWHIANLAPYNAVGDGATHDDVGIQAAIDAATAVKGGIVVLKPGSYWLYNTLAVNRGVKIMGPAFAEDLITTSDNTSDTSSSLVRLVWKGANNGTMIEFKSATSGNILYGGGVENVWMDGQGQVASGAGTAIRLSSTAFVEIKNVHVWSAKTQAVLLIDSNGGQSRYNVVDNLHWFFGPAAGSGCDGAYGVVLSGTWPAVPSTTGVTLNTIRHMTGTHYNGSCIYFGYSDNNQVLKLHSTVFSVGTGYGIEFQNHATGNICFQTMDKIFSATGANGNVLMHHTAEGGAFTIQSGSVLHVHSLDSVDTTYQRYATHAFALTDQLSFGAGDLMPTTGAATANSGGAVVGWVLADGGTNGIGGSKTIRDWHNGTITKAWIKFTNTVANGVCRLRLRVWTLTYGVPPSSQAYTAPEYDSNAGTPIDVTQDTNIVRADLVEVTLSTGVAYALGDVLQFNLERIGADGADTNTGSLVITEVIFYYTGTGPAGGINGGPWAVQEPV